MLNKIFPTALLSVTALTLTVLFILPTQSKAPPSERAYLIKNANIFNGASFTRNTDLLIQDGYIKAIGKALPTGKLNTIDATSKTIIPGLIDAHTHSFGDALSLAPKFGVTTHLDMFSPLTTLSSAKKNRDDIDQHKLADLFSAGILATSPRGHGTQFGPIDTLASPADAQAWVAKRIDEGSDFIKLVYMPYSSTFKSIDFDTAAAVVEAAHKNGLMVVAHIGTQRAARELLATGIDGFVHIFADEAVDNAFLKLAKKQRVFVVPTLSIIASADQKTFAAQLAQDSQVAPYLDDQQKQSLNAKISEKRMPGFDFELALANTRAMHRYGIPILAGSDAPNPGTSYGVSLHQELSLLVKAGLTPSQALESATKLPATLFKLAKRGTLATGSRADFIILNSSPETNIDNTLSISAIYKNGKLIDRTIPDNKNGEVGTPISSPALSRFDKDLSCTDDLVWSTSDDSMVNGNSQSRIELRDNVLNVTTKIQNKFMFPWAGVSLYGEKPLDLSGYQSLEFKVRGTAGQYRVMFFASQQNSIPPTQTFDVTQEWQTISLPLSGFSGFNLANFVGLSIVSGPKAGEFAYSLNDVVLVK